MSVSTPRDILINNLFDETKLSVEDKDFARNVFFIDENVNAFFRMLGFFLSDINKEKEYHSLIRYCVSDVKKFFVGNRLPSAVSLRNSKLDRLLLAVKFSDLSIFPTFIKSESCPIDLVLSFLQGLFSRNSTIQGHGDLSLRLKSIEGTRGVQESSERHERWLSLHNSNLGFRTFDEIRRVALFNEYESLRLIMRNRFGVISSLSNDTEIHLYILPVDLPMFVREIGKCYAM